MLFRGWSWRANLKIYSPNVSYCFVWERTKEGFLSKKRGICSLIQAIDLLDNSKNEDYETMLSYFYGVKMGYLIADKRSNEALEIGLQREKLLDRMSEQSKIRADLLDLAICVCILQIGLSFPFDGRPEACSCIL